MQRVRLGVALRMACLGGAALSGCGEEGRQYAAAQVLIGVDGRGAATITLIDNHWGQPPPPPQEIPADASPKVRAFMAFANGIRSIDSSQRPYQGRIADPVDAASEIATRLFPHATHAATRSVSLGAMVELQGLPTRAELSLRLERIVDVLTRQGLYADARVFLALCVDQDHARLRSVEGADDRAGGCAGWELPSNIAATELVIGPQQSRFFAPVLAAAVGGLLIASCGWMVLVAVRHRSVLITLAALAMGCAGLVVATRARFQLAAMRHPPTLTKFGVDLEADHRDAASQWTSAVTIAIVIEVIAVVAVMVYATRTRQPERRVHDLASQPH